MAWASKRSKKQVLWDGKTFTHSTFAFELERMKWFEKHDLNWIMSLLKISAFFFCPPRYVSPCSLKDLLATGTLPACSAHQQMAETCFSKWYVSFSVSLITECGQKALNAVRLTNNKALACQSELPCDGSVCLYFYLYLLHSDYEKQSKDILSGSHNLKGLFEAWDVILGLGLELGLSLFDC